MATLTLFEHETRPFAWTERDLSALDKLNRAAGAEILRFDVRGREHVVRANEHVGVVRLGRDTIQVLPKIYPADGSDEKAHARAATRNLLHLLAYAGGLTVREHDLAALLRREADWFEILTQLFAKNLRAEWQRGAHRSYQVVEAELPILKGKWRIAEQLRRPQSQHLFSVAFDEFTADNPLNRVLRFVTERLWHLTRDATNRRLLGELRQWMEDDVPLPPNVTSAEASAVTLTRQTARFKPLLTLARLFLDGGALQLAAGEATTFAFVFDMNALFEHFIAGFLVRHRVEILPSALEQCDILPQTRGATRHLAHRDGKALFRLKPDLAFRVGGTFSLLLDTKYKRLKPADKMLGIASADFYQMFAYAHRFECSRVLLLYPQTSEMPSPLRAVFPLQGSDKTIEVATVDLRVELEKSAGRQALIEELSAVIQGVL